MTSKMRFISDAPLLAFAVIFWFLTFVGCILAIYLVGQPDIAANKNEIVPIQISFVILFVVLSLGLVSALSRAICCITLTQDTITIQTGFLNKRTFSYKKFPFIYHGRYSHGNLFGNCVVMHYIVFSQSRVPQNTLCAINSLKCTDNTFKIRYTPSNYKRICKIIPVYMQRKLESVLSDLM